MKKQAVSIIRGLGRRLVVSSSTQSSRLNPGHAPLGMLDVERITRVSEPISSIVAFAGSDRGPRSSSFSAKV